MKVTYGLLLRWSLRVLSHRVASLLGRIVLLTGVMVGLRRGSLWRVVAAATGSDKVSPSTQPRLLERHGVEGSSRLTFAEVVRTL